MILIIDNYDSFVFNLARYAAELDYSCVVFRNNKITLDEIEFKIKPTHIILSPGPCTPNEAGICLKLVNRFKKTIPILGVCLGHQIIGQALGGKTVKAKQPMHGKCSRIAHDGIGLFENIVNPLRVGRYHSLVVDPKTISPDFHIHAISDEGDIMAMQHKQFPLYAVQFHIESIMTENGHALLKNFLYITK